MRDMKILVTIEDNLLKQVDQEAERLGVNSRSLLISQILRKHFNLPNLFENKKEEKQRHEEV
jgi:metal-responsive CopG/Arc/MetJ family transcriptional regulator